MDKMKYIMELSLLSRYLVNEDVRVAAEWLKIAFDALTCFFDTLDEMPLHYIFVFKNLIETALITNCRIIYLELMGMLLSLSEKFPLASKMYFNYHSFEDFLH
jgi:hypothetical protein